MAKVISGRDIFKNAKAICGADQEVCLAVSYWSGNAVEALGIAGDRNIKVVLDVNGGGTSPDELRKLMALLGDNVRVHEDLHAKIYASKSVSMVGSANASKPGLHLNGKGHAEAAVLLDGDEAKAALKLAKAFFKAGEIATKADVKTCEDRFMKKTVGLAEAGEIETLPFLKALREHPELYLGMPLIVTDGDASEEDALKSDDEFRENFGSNIDDEKWDNFQWKLNSKYFDKNCVAIHKDDDGKIFIGLVRPAYHDGGEWTFASRLNWDQISGLKYEGSAPEKIRKNAKHLDLLSDAIDKLADSKKKTFLTCRDLIKALGWH